MDKDGVLPERYLTAFDSFREELARDDTPVVSLALYRAAKVLSDTPLSAKFFDVVQGVNDGRIYPEANPTQKRNFLSEQAGFALLNCYKWRAGAKLTPYQ